MRPSGYDEPDDPSASPRDLAIRHARAKALDVRAAVPRSVVVAADTVVDVDGVALNKPANAADATRMLGMLSGRTHLVHTAFAICVPGADGLVEDTGTTSVRFYTLAPAEIAEYVATGEPMDKAGGYGIQGRAASLVESIDGDFYTVMGFPLARFVRALRRLGFRFRYRRTARLHKALAGPADLYLSRRAQTLCIITIIIVAALLALVQIAAERSGGESPLTVVGMSLASFAQSAVTATIGAVRGAGSAAASLPQLERDNAALTAENARLQQENQRLHELSAQYASQVDVRPVVDEYAGAIQARVIGFPPENESRTVTIDRGSNAGVHKDDGVLANGGVVGRIAAVTPFSSQVVLITITPAVFPR